MNEIRQVDQMDKMEPDNRFVTSEEEAFIRITPPSDNLSMQTLKSEFVKGVTVTLKDAGDDAGEARYWVFWDGLPLPKTGRRGKNEKAFGNLQDAEALFAAWCGYAAQVPGAVPR